MQRFRAALRDNWVRASIVGAALLLWLVTLRYGLTLHLTDKNAIGVAGGGLFIQERAPMAPGVGPFSRPIKPDHRVFYAYRHAFSIQWWYSYRTPTSIRVPATSWTAEVPLWPLVALAVLPLAWGMFRWVPAGYCKRCRYDLRGTPGDVCPECGTSKPASR